MDHITANKRMKKEDRKIQILDAAMSVFVDKGYSGSTTAEIAKAADISEVTLFRYFSSKQEIFLQGIEPILLDTLNESMNASSGLTGENKLEHILMERISLISRNYRIIKLILNEAQLLTELGADNFMNRILQLLESMLNQMGLKLKDKEFTLRLIMGSILSCLYMPEPDEEKTRAYIRHMVRLISISLIKATGGEE